MKCCPMLIFFIEFLESLCVSVSVCTDFVCYVIVIAFSHKVGKFSCSGFHNYFLEKQRVSVLNLPEVSFTTVIEHLISDVS